MTTLLNAPSLMESLQKSGGRPPETAEPPAAEAPAGSFFKPLLPVWRRGYSLEPDFIAFQGHFEGRPVLPALAQTLMAKVLAQAIWPQAAFISAIVSAKFIRPVAPPARLTVYAQPPAAEPGPGPWRFQLTDDADGAPVALLRLELK